MILHMPEGIGHLDWQAHRRLRDMGYQFALAQINRLRAEGHPLFCQI